MQKVLLPPNHIVIITLTALFVELELSNVFPLDKKNVPITYKSNTTDIGKLRISMTLNKLGLSTGQQTIVVQRYRNVKQIKGKGMKAEILSFRILLGKSVKAFT